MSWVVSIILAISLTRLASWILQTKYDPRQRRLLFRRLVSEREDTTAMGCTLQSRREPSSGQDRLIQLRTNKAQINFSRARSSIRWQEAHSTITQQCKSTTAARWFKSIVRISLIKSFDQTGSHSKRAKTDQWTDLGIKARIKRIFLSLVSDSIQALQRNS